MMGAALDRISCLQEDALLIPATVSRTGCRAGGQFGEVHEVASPQWTAPSRTNLDRQRLHQEDVYGLEMLNGSSSDQIT